MFIPLRLISRIKNPRKNYKFYIPTFYIFYIRTLSIYNLPMARKHKIILTILVSLVAIFVLLFTPRTRLWELPGEELVQIEAQGEVTPLPVLTEADLDGDGILEHIRLEDGQAGLYGGAGGEEPLWQSPAEWQVKQAQVTDLNRDGQPEAALLVWRPFQPWPVDSYLVNPGRIQDFQDKKGRSCQLILVGWITGEWREVWAGSALADPLLTFAAADLDGNFSQELIVLEKHYNDAAFLPARALSVWEWNGFGFSLLSRQTGAFCSLEVVNGTEGTSKFRTENILNFFVTDW